LSTTVALNQFGRLFESFARACKAGCMKLARVDASAAAEDCQTDALNFRARLIRISIES